MTWNRKIGYGIFAFLLILIFIVAVCAAKPRQGEMLTISFFKNANELYNLCNPSSGDTIAQGLSRIRCSMYIEGVSDEYSAIVHRNWKDDTTPLIIEHTFDAYVYKHPESKSHMAAEVIILASEDAELFKKD